MSEAKVVIAESIIENFEAVNSSVARQSLRDMVDVNKDMRDEVARLNRAMGIATVALRYYAKTAISIKAVDALEKIEAAITPQAGKGGGNG